MSSTCCEILKLLEKPFFPLIPAHTSNKNWGKTKLKQSKNYVGDPLRGSKRCFISSLQTRKMEAEWAFGEIIGYNWRFVFFGR